MKRFRGSTVRKTAAFALTAALIGAYGVYLPAAETNAAAADAAAMVLNDGVVYTVEGEDWDKTPMQSVAVGSDGRILYVGDDAGAEAYVTEETKVIDLNGKVVLPAFGDSHVHPPGTALTEMYNIYLYESITKEQVLADIKEYIDAHPDLDAYWGSGFTMGIGGAEAEGKGPKKEWLDEICSDKPVILTSNDGHSRWLNSKALEMNNITKDTVHPTGTVQKGQDGELWGTLTDASSLIGMEQTFQDSQHIAGLKKYQQSMHQWGYTFGNMILPSPEYGLLMKQLEEDGEWKMHANVATRIAPTSEFEQDLKTFLDLREALKDTEYVHATTVKFFEDGVVEGMTAYLSEPYDKAAGLAEGFVSVPLWDVEDLKEYFTTLIKNDIQVHVHSIGDQATTEVVDALVYAQEQNPGVDKRNTITHLQVVKDSDKARMGKAGIIASTQPYWHLKEPEWYEFVDSVALGEARAYKEYPVKSFIDNGALVTFSGDYPVSPINNPFWAIEAAVTRNLNNADYYGVDDITSIDDPTWLLNPAERISVKQAIEAYTVNVAYQLFSEDVFGSIKAGKRADLIIVDQDILKANPIDIDKTEVLATIFSGEFVYEADAFDTSAAAADADFADIVGHWAEDDIRSMLDKGLFSGAGEGVFSPDSPMTRGMLVTVLGRLYGADLSGFSASPFSDVPAGQYYAPYVEWAKENGIVNGVGDDLFAPNGEISRQDLATIITRYSEFAGKSFAVTMQFTTFADEGDIAAYAKNAIQTLYNAGIINGVGENRIDPKGQATRAQVAAILNRFIDK
jgi:predicted amidohydrolase YtcJ